MCCTTPISATISGGRRSAAATRKTIAVWYEWSCAVLTTKSCAIPASDARITKVSQPCVCMSRRAIGGATPAAAMAAEILSRRVPLAHTSSGANLVSGVASTLLATRGAELGLFEVDEAALPEIARRVRPRAVCLGNLFRDQLDRYGELELVADRWRTAVQALPADSALVVNGDDPQVGDLGRERDPRTRTVFGVDDPRQAHPALQHAADSIWCIRCGTAYEYAAAYIGHLGDYRCPACGHARPPLDIAAREIELEGIDRVSFDLITPEGLRRVQ